MKIIRQLREPVRFAQGLAAVRQKGCSVLLEVGPKPTLLGLARQNGVDADTALPARGPVSPSPPEVARRVRAAFAYAGLDVTKPVEEHAFVTLVASLVSA